LLPSRSGRGRFALEAFTQIAQRTNAPAVARPLDGLRLGVHRLMPRRVNIPSFSPFLYRYRNLVERFFGKIKHFSAVATRFEKHDANYLAIVKLVAARIWMRFMSR
jgi:transposase